MSDLRIRLSDYVNIVEDTNDRYPRMARAGWCFSGNVTKADIKTENDKKNYATKKIDRYAHFEVNSVIIGFGYKAYWTSGHMDPKMLPTFVRVNKEDILKELYYDGRCSEIDAAAIDIKITRFDLMELVEES